MRCYVGDAQHPIPVMSMMSFDHEEFYLGSFYPGVPPGQETEIFVRSDASKTFFRDYWHELWNSAVALNKDGPIDWPKVEQVATQIGINEDALRDIVSQVKAEIGS